MDIKRKKGAVPKRQKVKEMTKTEGEEKGKENMKEREMEHRVK